LIKISITSYHNGDNIQFLEEAESVTNIVRSNWRQRQRIPHNVRQVLDDGWLPAFAFVDPQFLVFFAWKQSNYNQYRY